jgi:hypothetical protein
MDTSTVNKAKRSKKTLARLTLTTDNEEPDLDKVYQSELILSEKDWIEYNADELCCSNDTVEDADGTGDELD